MSNQTRTKQKQDARVESLFDDDEKTEQTSMEVRQSSASQRYEPNDLGELWKYGKIVVQSNLCPKHIDSPADVVMIVQRGAELGLSAMVSLQNMFVEGGRIGMSADLAVAVVRSSEACEYFRSIEKSRERAEFETQRRGEPKPERFSFSMQDAETAGLTNKFNWRSYPRQMLIARAKIGLARLQYEDILAGIYTPEELGAQVDPETGMPADDDSDVVDADFDEGAAEPDISTKERQQRETCTERMHELVAEVGIEPGSDQHRAFEDGVCDRRDVDQWLDLSTQELNDINGAIAGYSPTGGRRSPRRRFVDLISRDLDEPTADVIDWQATGHDEDDDWQALNGRWRSLVAEALSGDEKQRQYHEALKARHEVTSFNDLTSEQLVQDIATLEPLTAADPNGHMPPRTEHILAEIDEHIPQSEEMDFGEGSPEGSGEDEPITLDGVELDGAPARFVWLLREGGYRDEWISMKLEELSPEGDIAAAEDRHVEPFLPSGTPDQEQHAEWVDSLSEWLDERRKYREERGWPISPKPGQRVRGPKKKGQLEREPEARRGRSVRPGDDRREMRKDRQPDEPSGLDADGLPEPHRKLVELLDDIDPEYGRRYIDKVVIPQSNCEALADMPDGAAERWAEIVRGCSQEWLHTKIS